MLVKVYGAGAGPWDVGFLSGGFPGVGLPFVPGQEVAGVVEAAGGGTGVGGSPGHHARPGELRGSGRAGDRRRDGP